MRTCFCLVLTVLSLLVSACGTTASAQPMETATPIPPTPVPTATAVPPTPTPFPCDANAVRLEVAGSYEEFQQASQSYEESYTLYCVWVPEGARSLEIGVSGLMNDLDVYIGTDAGITVYTDYGEWESAHDGIVGETVTIPEPHAGVYYIQVVSFERLPSQYTLLVNIEE